MRAFFDGVEGNEVTRFKGADGSVNVMLTEDSGTPITITGDTVSIDVYTSAVRGTPVASFAGVIGVATAGFYTVALAAGSMTFGPGTYYCFAKRVHALATTFGDTYSKMVVQ